MKVSKRIVTILTAVSLITSLASINVWALHTENTETENERLSEEKIYSAYNCMMNSYKTVVTEYTGSPYRNASTRNIVVKDLPDEYGGAHYNASGDGKIDIYLTTMDNSNEYVEFYGKNNVNIHQVKYSYDYLVEICDIMIECPYVNYVGTDEEENKVFIGVSDFYSASEIFSYISNNAIPSDVYYFEINEERFSEEQSSNLNNIAYSGTEVKVKNTDYSSTITTIAYRSATNQYGIITSAHLVDGCDDNDILQYNGIDLCTVGECIVKSTAYSDYMFIPFELGTLATTKMYKNIANNSTGYIGGMLNWDSYQNQYEINQYEPLENIYVTGYGKTTGGGSGVVKSTYFNDTGSGGTNKCGMVAYSINTFTFGDSGAPVGVMMSSNSNLWILFIHTISRSSYRGTIIGAGYSIYDAAQELGVII